MPRKKTVLLDMDGVLVDFITAAMKRFGYDAAEVYTRNEAKGVFEIADIIGVSRNAFYTAFNDREFWESLPWMPEGKAIYEAVLNGIAGTDTELFLCTSPMRSPGCFAGKAAWVERELGTEILSRLFICGAKHKFANCDTLLIDDSERNVMSFAVHGGHTITVPRPWNAYHAHPSADFCTYIEQTLRYFSRSQPVPEDVTEGLR